MLVRFGYPYVLATWFFHMTLTRPAVARGTCGRGGRRRSGIFRGGDCAETSQWSRTFVCLRRPGRGRPFVIEDVNALRG